MKQQLEHLPAIVNGNKINLEVELFSLDGSKIFNLKSSKQDINKAAELGIKVGEALKKSSLIILTKNNMHILLTRPLEDCHEMMLKFQSLDHECISFTFN